MDLAKIGDQVVCSCNGGPHRIVTGASTVFVDDMPVARVGDASSCGATIVSGAAWFEVENSPVAIDGSQTSCGGHVVAAATASTDSPTSIDVGGFRFQQAPPVVAETQVADDAIAASSALASGEPQPMTADAALPTGAQDASSTSTVEPGFHIIRRRMSSQALETELLGQSSPAVREKFRALNPHLAQGARPAQMAVLSDPENLMCTAEDTQLGEAATHVDAALATLDDDDAQFLVENYHIIASFLDYSSAGVGASTAMVGQHLTNVERTLREIEGLHQRSFAQHGHLNSPEFFAQRRQLFTRLDHSMAPLVRQGTGFPDHPSLRHALGISTRSLTHQWRHAGVGEIPGYATHIDGVARAAKYIRAGGWIGVGLGGVASYAKVQEACVTGREEECRRVKFEESGKFLGGVGGGIVVGFALSGTAAATVCGAIGLATVGVGGIACGLVVVGVGGIVGGKGGTNIGEYFGNKIYEGLFQ